MVSISMGSYLTRIFLTNNSFTLTVILDFLLGFGLISYGVLALGLSGFLNRNMIVFWLIILLILASCRFNYLISLVKKGSVLIRNTYAELLSHYRYYLLFIITLLTGFFLIWFFSLIMALTPPWDYDGLMYHLEGPRRFLELGKIQLMPDLWGANNPMLGEMVYLIGVALSLDIFPKIIHWFFGLLYCLITYHVGKSLLNKTNGYLSVIILCGLVYLPFLASWAYIDLIWSSLEIFSIYLLLTWDGKEKYDTKWLILCGVVMGLSLSTKYLALSGYVAALFVIFIKTYRNKWLLIKSLAVYSVTAFLVVSPWYIKNWILGGNPIYPLLFGGRDFPIERWQLLSEYLRGFGVGYSVREFFLLPINIYLNHKFFVSFLGSVDIPSPLFLIMLTVPFFYKKMDKVTYLLIAIIFIRIILWFIGTQQTRFLYPVFPYISLVTSSIFILLMKLPLNHILRSIRNVTILSTLSIPLFVSLAKIIMTSVIIITPWRLWSGQESPVEFTKRLVPSYEIIKYTHDLPSRSKVLLIWEGRGYYCSSNCILDTEHSNWIRIAQHGEWDNQTISTILVRQQIEYILIDEKAPDFLRLHDPQRTRSRAHEFLVNEFLPKCGKVIKKNLDGSLYAINCGMTDQ